MPDNVTAPYHFVPLSKWTCLPVWASQISQDQPFSDGISGQLNIEIEAHSPLLIAGERSNNQLEFVKNPDNKPYLPGSSIRGMIRNVLEIASFADMNMIDDARFGSRDISSAHTSYSEYYKKHKTVAGWLKFDGIDWQFKTSDFLEIKYSESIKIDPALDDSNNPIVKYQAHPLSREVSFSEYTQLKKNRGNVRYASCDPSAANKGHIVFVGAMKNASDPKKSKVGDYIFYAPEGKKQTVDLELIRDFQISHRDYGGLYKVGGEKQTLFDYLQYNQHPEYGIPVFALVDKINPKKLHALGLAKMMKIAVPNGIETLYKRHKSMARSDSAEIKSRRLDLVQGIFGMTRDKAGYSQKSRVSFSDAHIKGDCTVLDNLNTTVQGQPVASFYPAYLEQKQGEKYNDYFKSNSRLAGWKRYPVKNNWLRHLPEPPNDNPLVSVKLKPLDSGVKFMTTLRFHNLKKIELGAIFWALNFGTKNDAFHSLGMGKPFGFGKVSLTMHNKKTYTTYSDDTTPLSISDLSTCFTDYMEQQYHNIFGDNKDWIESPQLKNLLAMAIAGNDNTLRNMSLNEYTKSRTRKIILPPYKNIARDDPSALVASDLDGNYQYPTSEAYEEVLAKRKAKEVQEGEQRIIENKAKNELEALKQNASDLTIAVINAIDEHKNNLSYSLDQICEDIISSKPPESQAAKLLLAYVNNEGKKWKSIKRKDKKEKRKQYLQLLAEISN